MTLTTGESDSSDTNNEIESTETGHVQVTESENARENLTREQMLSKAHEYFTEGKRLYVCEKFQDAVDAFDLACENYCNYYGDLAIESAEPFFYFGKSLIGLERVNQELLNEAKRKKIKEKEEAAERAAELAAASKEAKESVPAENKDVAAEGKDEPPTMKDPKEEGQSKEAKNKPKEAPAATSGDKKQPDEKDQSKEAENKPKEAPAATSGGEKQSDEKDQSKKVENKSKEAAAATSGDKKQPDNEGKSKTAESKPKDASVATSDDEEEPSLVDEEDVTVLSSAWQFLDLARIIYERHLPGIKEEQKRKDIFMRLSEIRVSLGEVCVLDDKFDDAVDEFEIAKKILNEHFPGEDRRLSEAYFKIGSALEYGRKFDMAQDNFKNAIEVLASRLKKLEIDEKNKSQTKTTRSKATKAKTTPEKMDLDESKSKEIDELKELIAEMNQRLADAVQAEEEQERASRELDEYILRIIPPDVPVSIPLAYILQRKLAQSDAPRGSGESSKEKGGSGDSSKTPADDVSHLVHRRVVPIDDMSRYDDSPILSREDAAHFLRIRLRKPVESDDQCESSESDDSEKIPADDVTHLVHKGKPGKPDDDCSNKPADDDKHSGRRGKPLKRDPDPAKTSPGEKNVSEPKRVKFDDEARGDKKPAPKDSQTSSSERPVTETGDQSGSAALLEAPISEKGAIGSSSKPPS